MSIFEIDADICRAETLSSEFYTSDAYFEESKEKIFARSWQVAAVADNINNLKPVTILENFLDEQLLLVKTKDQIDCLSNVCTHRGKILIEEDCQANRIRCGYHGRRFDLNGKFLSMPEFERAENFPTAKDNLQQISTGILGDLAFVSINPLDAFDEFFAPVRQRLDWLDWNELKFSEKDSHNYFVNAHWALYCENYLEGFHIPFVHKSLNETINYDAYSTETFRYASLQTGFAKTGEDAFDFDQKIAALYFFIFPNLMLNFYPWGLSVNIVKPLEKNLTKVSYLTFISDESKTNRGAGADLATVEYEDQAVVESVQRGINSRFYERGRYSATREQGTHHFHRLIAEFMTRG